MVINSMHCSRRLHARSSAGPKKAAMWLLIGILLIFSSPAVRSEGPLDAYKGAVGTPLEKGMLAYARACVHRVLDPGNPVPDYPPDMNDLPMTGMYLTLMRGKDIRACVGSFYAPASNPAGFLRALAKYVVYDDIRKEPLSLTELAELSLVISFVGPRREILDPYSIDFSTEGLLIAQEGRHAVLLPGETRTLDYGIRMLIRQYNLSLAKPISYSTFEVIAFDERRWR